MSEEKTSAWPFADAPDTEGLDINAIFGGSTATTDVNPFEVPEPVQPEVPAAAEPEAPQETVKEPPTPIAGAEQPEEPTSQQPDPVPAPEPTAEAENPIAAAFGQKTVENAQVGLLEKPPVFSYQNAKEPISGPGITFEELRLLKYEDFTDLEDGKNVSWCVEYCGIHRNIRDPKGTLIVDVKKEIERSKEFLDALKKAKDKNPDCLVTPKVTGQKKGQAVYRGCFDTMEEARESDKVICLLPSNDGKIYELRKTDAGEFTAPKHKVMDFQEIRAGFTPALPKIPMSLLRQIITFFRTFMGDDEQFEAMAHIYWDKEKEQFFAYVPKQEVSKDEITADLRGCPYDNSERYLLYADIHSHNSMKAFFSPTDDQDEKSTRLYMVVGRLDKFFPDIQVRFFCGGTHVPIDPSLVIEDLWEQFPPHWMERVTRKPAGTAETVKKTVRGFFERVVL